MLIDLPVETGVGRPAPSRLGRSAYLSAGLALLIPCLIFLPMLFGRHIVQDDYYYYERIARNFLQGAGSTFDGIVSTNGYQPLWMGFVLFAVMLEKLTGVAAHNWTLVLSSLLSMATFLMVRARTHVETLYSLALAFALAAYLIFFGWTGMEVSLLLFCGAWVFGELTRSDYRLTTRAATALGLCFLARIDSLIYFLPLVLYLSWRDRNRRTLFALYPLVAMVGCYGVLNWIVFGLPVPVSGVAKSVLRITTFHAATWMSLIEGPRQERLQIAATAALSVYLWVVGSRRIRRLLSLSLLGVILYFALTSLRSDWGLWSWYEFPFALHLLLLASIDDKSPHRESRSVRWLGYAVVLVCGLALALVGPRNVKQARGVTSIFSAAERLEKFFGDKSTAVVAMGDRAGAVGAILPNRLVQLEGLVMDRGFLDTMRQATSLQNVFRTYHVDYYVATNPAAAVGGCYATREPAQSNGDSILVRSSICSPVVLDFFIEGWHTVVFDLRQGYTGQ